MPGPKKVYINNQFYLHLSEEYNDRPEFHRHHEHSLWTIYQVMKAGNNLAVIHDDNGAEEIRISTAADFWLWVSRTYPGFQDQLDKESYTKYPHPDDRLL